MEPKFCIMHAGTHKNTHADIRGSTHRLVDTQNLHSDTYTPTDVHIQVKTHLHPIKTCFFCFVPFRKILMTQMDLYFAERN